MAGPWSSPAERTAGAPATTYRIAHPQTASLVIEVSRTSRRIDLGIKATLYSRAGVADYWVVDLVGDAVVVHRDPVGDAYTSVTRHTTGTITALARPLTGAVRRHARPGQGVSSDRQVPARRGSCAPVTVPASWSISRAWTEPK